jgi:hypothetical protein
VNPQTDHTGSNSSPWLVWIDDNPSNNTTEVEFAHRKGVTVFHFYSTASAKAWIVANEGENDIVLKIIITDHQFYSTSHS